MTMERQEQENYYQEIRDASMRGPDSGRSVVLLLGIIARLLVYMARKPNGL